MGIVRTLKYFQIPLRVGYYGGTCVDIPHRLHNSEQYEYIVKYSYNAMRVFYD